MLNELIQIAKAAGEEILKYYQVPLTPDIKPDNTPVTIADRKSSDLIVARLQAMDPKTPILCEEVPIPPYESRKGWTQFWLVDPLDGTKEFIKNRGEFTVNIARITHDQPDFGIIHLPLERITYFADAIGGSWKQLGDGVPKRIYSNVADKSKSITVVRSRSNTDEQIREMLPEIKIKELIAAGSAAKFGLLSEGRADVYARLVPCSEWDVASGDCLFQYSGRDQKRKTSFTYNKPDLHVKPFVLGLEDAI